MTKPELHQCDQLCDLNVFFFFFFLTFMSSSLFAHLKMEVRVSALWPLCRENLPTVKYALLVLVMNLLSQVQD